MQLAYAYICVDREDIFDPTSPKGYAEAGAREINVGACPRCMSKTIWPLTAWVPTCLGVVPPGAERSRAAKNITVAALKLDACPTAGRGAGVRRNDGKVGKQRLL